MRPALVWWCTAPVLAVLIGACDRPASRAAVRGTTTGASVTESAGGTVAAPTPSAGARPVAPPTPEPRGASGAASGAAATPRPPAAAGAPGASGAPAATPTGSAAGAASPASGAAAAAPPPASPALAPAPAAPPTPAASATPAPPATPARAFAPGERFDYEVKYGFIHAGDAVLQVLGVDAVRGTPALHARFTVKGGTRFYKVDDDYESWFDPRTMSSLRYVQRVDEGRYRANRDFEIYPAQQTFTENGKAPQPSVAQPLDEASFIYFLRTIPLEPGKTYDFDRYFRPDRNPVRVVVLRRERITVPAGTFNTVVVRPVIKAKGLFGEGGQAEVWLSDDSSRTMVQMRSHLPIGSLSLYLTSLRH